MSNPETGRTADVDVSDGAFRGPTDMLPQLPARGIKSPNTVDRPKIRRQVRSPHREVATSPQAATSALPESSSEVHIRLGDPTGQAPPKIPEFDELTVPDRDSLNEVEINASEGEGNAESLSLYQRHAIRSYPVFTTDQTLFLVAARDQDEAEATYLENGAKPLSPAERVREIRQNQVFPQPGTNAKPEEVEQYNNAFHASTTVENLIVNGHARLPAFFASINQKKYDIPFKELVSVAGIGLKKAAHGYDPAKGASFSYFTGLKIWGEWSHYLRTRNAAFHSTKAIGEVTGKIRAADKVYENKYGRRPTREELITFIAEAPKGAPYAFKEDKAPHEEILKQAISEHLVPITISSIDVSVTDRGGSLSEVRPAQGGDFAEQVELGSALGEAFDRLGLSERQRQVLQLNIVEGRGPMEICKTLGISRKAVEHARSSALDKLRNDASLKALWTGE